MIETMALLRRIRTIHPVSVQLTRTNFWQVAMPDHVSLFRKRNAKSLTLAGDIKQTEFHLLCVLRVKSEVDPLAVPSGSQGIRPAGPYNRLRLMRHLSRIPEASRSLGCICKC